MMTSFPWAEGYFLPGRLPRFEDDFLKPPVQFLYSCPSQGHRRFRAERCIRRFSCRRPAPLLRGYPGRGEIYKARFRIQRFSGGFEHLDDQFPLGEGYFLPDRLPRFEDDFLKPLFSFCIPVLHKDIVGSGQNGVFVIFTAVPPRFFEVFPVVGRFVEPGFRSGFQQESGILMISFPWAKETSFLTVLPGSRTISLSHCPVPVLGSFTRTS